MFYYAVIKIENSLQWFYAFWIAILICSKKGIKTTENITSLKTFIISKTFSKHPKTLPDSDGGNFAWNSILKYVSDGYGLLVEVNPLDDPLKETQ